MLRDVGSRALRKTQVRALVIATFLAATLVSLSSPAAADHTGFDKGEYQVAEGDEYAELFVITTFCCPVPQGQIDYYTSNSSAIAGEDYQQTSGTLTFAGTTGGEKIRVPLIDEDLFEGEERFVVTLTNYRGTFINRGNSTAVVRILDDEASGSSSSGTEKPASSKPSDIPRSRNERSAPPVALGGGSTESKSSGEHHPTQTASSETMVNARSLDDPAANPQQGQKRSNESFPIAGRAGAFALVSALAIWLGWRRRTAKLDRRS